jgi:hypothetical protein
MDTVVIKQSCSMQGMAFILVHQNRGKTDKPLDINFIESRRMILIVRFTVLERVYN